MEVEGSEAQLQEENFNCERCPRSFKNKLGLGAHKLVHGRRRKKIGRQMKRKKAKYKSFVPPSNEVNLLIILINDLANIHITDHII